MSSIPPSAEEQELLALAKRVLPGGHFGNFPAEIILREGRGAHVWDVSGREYIDYLLGSGPMYIGHNHPKVTEAVLAQVPLGTTFFANNEHGIRLAAAIVDAMPCVEQVRFVSSGSEADLYAMRLARAYRKRPKIVKFEGGYHGMSDWGLMSLAPKKLANFPEAVPDTPGIPDSVRGEVLVAPFNDIEAAVRLIEARHDEIGGVIMEPFQRLIPPKPGFLQAIREVTARLGIPLIFDEVVTGFRFAYGGAQEYYGVTPDICTMGKAITGGYFPLSITMYNEKIHQTLPTNFDWDHGYTYNFSLSGINSALKYMDILEKEQVLNNHQTIQNTAVKTIQSTGFEILNRFGCLYMIRKGNYKNLYIVPLNATEEYFTVLKQNLESYENN